MLSGVEGAKSASSKSCKPFVVISSSNCLTLSLTSLITLVYRMEFGNKFAGDCW